MADVTLRPLIALIGSPNTGKSSLFNRLTGGHQKVGNYAGVTVEKRSGYFESAQGRSFEIVDLPGTPSLDAETIDQSISRDFILARQDGEEHPDLVLAVADATNLERSLNLVIEITQIGIPTVLALNMYDLAKSRGLELDLEKLSLELGVPVVPTVATKGEGVEKLAILAESLIDFDKIRKQPKRHWVRPTPKEIRGRFARIDQILEKCIRVAKRPDSMTDRLDRIFLHPVAGLFILAAILTIVFQTIFAWAQPLMDGIDTGFSSLGDAVSATLPPGPVQDLIVDGIIAGVGGVLIFLPQILFLFFFIILLEESGYLARAAFLLDRALRRFGLHGKSFIPLLSSHACAIPGIMAARTIDNPRDRLATVLVAPLTTCSARLPVYALLISAFIPNEKVLGFLGLQGLVLFGLYIAGILSAILMALLFRSTFLRGGSMHFMLELPSYKIPNPRNVLIGLWDRAKIFLKRAGTLIFGLSILLWFLASYPKSPEGATEPAIQYSFAGRIGRTIEPVFRPLGFDWHIATGLIPGFAAREVMVAALATVYAVEDSGKGQTALSDDEVESKLGGILKRDWSLATALSLLVWFIYAPQCIATWAVFRRETHSWKWTGFLLFYTIAMAYMASMVTYQVATWIGWG